jgi:hypothetical protein
MKLVTKKQALKIMQGLLIAVVIFHLSIITRLIPHDIVWAGKLKTVQEMYTFEAVSIAINLFLITLLMLKERSVNSSRADKVLNVFLWLFILLFAANTIGNLMAKTLFEKLVFTPLTFLFTLLLWRIVKKETPTHE